MTLASRVAIYGGYRAVSEGERSIAYQIRLCRERTAHRGCDGTEGFWDVGPSGGSRSRPALDAMLTRAPDLDIVIAETVDRLSSDRRGFEAMRKQLEADGCGLATGLEETIGGSPERP